MVTLVTGSTGFIGRLLVRYLINKEGAEVKCLVRSNSDVSSLKELGVEIVLGDVTNVESLKDAVRNVDTVYHCAGLVETGFIQHYDALYRVNVEGTRNLIEAVSRSNLRKFVFFSSMAALGTRNIACLVKEDAECKPDTQYGKSKYEAEKMLLNYHSETGLPVVIVRPATVYGIGEKYNFLKLTKAIKNRRFLFIGDGANLTSMCYVENLLDAVVLSGKKGTDGHIYHLADSRPYSWKDIVSAISKELGIQGSPRHVSPRIAWAGASFFEGFAKVFKFEPPLYKGRVNTLTANFAFDISLARNELGYEPKFSFEEGLKVTIQWYKDEKLI